MASQSRQVNFSRTCSTIFQRRGSHSSVFDTSSAELAQSDAAALAAGAWRGLDDALDPADSRELARSARRAGAPVLGCAGRGDLGLGLFLGLRLFEVFDRQLELLDEQLATLRRLTEHLAARLGEHQLQALDFQGADFRFARRHDQHLALREDHRMRAGERVGKIFEAVRHDPN